MNDSLKKIGLFAGGVLFGIAGLKILNRYFPNTLEKKLPKCQWSVVIRIHSK